MKDFSLIDLNPIAPEFVELQTRNQYLESENDTLKGIFFSLALLGALSGTYLMLEANRKKVITIMNNGARKQTIK